MGLAASSPLRYEGYGRNILEAVLSLDALIRFHHDNTVVRKQTIDNHIRYYVRDANGEHTVYFERCRNYIRAWIHL